MTFATLRYVDVCLFVVALYLLRQLVSKRSPPLPPGPRRLWLLGNLLDMPREKEWLTFAKWREQYGNISSVSVFGKTIIIINSAKVASELLDKKGAIYSDRPIFQMGGELVGWKNSLALTPYGERFQHSRRIAHKFFGSSVATKQFNPVMEDETHRMLQWLQDTPADFGAHIRKTVGAIVLRFSYGYRVKEGNDPFIALADEATEQFSQSISPGILVNNFPSLRLIPEWLPGGGFHKTAKLWAKTLQDMVDLPFLFTKQRFSNGISDESFVSSMLQAPEFKPEKEFDIKWIAASFYAGGADTPVAVIYAFFKAMAVFPEVQRKAQAEIDVVVGDDRLPSFSDWENLPYINALVLEVLRWHTVSPSGAPHRVTEDDIYDGYLIPAGSIVIGNIWQMMHDPLVYPEPERFNPDRFLANPPQPDPRDVTFGFGRRICPGRQLAVAIVYITCVMTLAAFDIRKSEKDGQIIEPPLEQKPGLLSHPTEFQCSIKPRSEKAAAMIKGRLYNDDD